MGEALKRTHYMRSSETKKKLDEIENLNGAKHSAIIRVAVDKYHKEIIKKE